MELFLLALHPEQEEEFNEYQSFSSYHVFESFDGLVRFMANLPEEQSYTLWMVDDEDFLVERVPEVSAD